MVTATLAAAFWFARRQPISDTKSNDPVSVNSTTAASDDAPDGAIFINSAEGAVISPKPSTDLAPAQIKARTPRDPAAWGRNGFFLWTFLYPGLALKSCQLLQECEPVCAYIGQQGCPSYLRADPQVDCDLSAHGTYTALAGLAFGLVCLAMPLALFLVLYRERDRIARVQACTLLEPAAAADRTVAVRALSYTFESYKGDRYWWAVVEQVRVVLFTGVVLFLPPDSYSQIVFGVGLAACFIWALEHYQPYRKPEHHWMAQAALFVTGAILLFGMSLRSLENEDSTRTDADKDRDRENIGLVLIVMTLLFLVGAGSVVVLRVLRSALGLGFNFLKACFASFRFRKKPRNGAANGSSRHRSHHHAFHNDDDDDDDVYDDDDADDTALLDLATGKREDEQYLGELQKIVRDASMKQVLDTIFT